MNLRPVTARSDAAIHNVWRLPAADAMRGHRGLWWSVGPAGELAVLLVHRRYLDHSRSIKGWIGWGPAVPLTGELVTNTGQEKRRTLVKDIRIRPSHLALLPDSRFLPCRGHGTVEGLVGSWDIGGDEQAPGARHARWSGSSSSFTLPKCSRVRPALRAAARTLSQLTGAR